MIAGMLRVKNEARWITEVIAALHPVCERIFVMDDHSTDGTVDLAEQAGAVVWPTPFDGMDEARDKSAFVRQIARFEPGATWCLCVDGDEILDRKGPEEIRNSIASGQMDAYTLRIVYLWDRRDQIRVDGVYGRFARPSLFRLAGDLSFLRTGAHKNLHCSSVPARYIGHCGACPATLLHLGYMEKEDRIRKFAFYNAIDPHNSAEDGYKHMVIGDIFPTESHFRHAGPLRLMEI